MSPAASESDGACGETWLQGQPVVPWGTRGAGVSSICSCPSQPLQRQTDLPAQQHGVSAVSMSLAEACVAQVQARACATGADATRAARRKQSGRKNTSLPIYTARSGLALPDPQKSPIFAPPLPHPPQPISKRRFSPQPASPRALTLLNDAYRSTRIRAASRGCAYACRYDGSPPKPRSSVSRRLGGRSCRGRRAAVRARNRTARWRSASGGSRFRSERAGNRAAR